MRRTSLECVWELAQRDERVVFVGSDLGPEVLAEMKRAMPERFFPERFFMEGVSEANVIGLAAGLAMEGFVPYVNTVATSLTRRCYEQIALDLCLQNLPVRLIGNGGGLVYAPLGPTHLAVEDLAILRALPNMTVTAACDADEVRRLMHATLDVEGPLYVRLGRGGGPIVSQEASGFTLGRAIEMRPVARVTILSTGTLTERALRVAEVLEREGTPCGVTHFHTIKPLDAVAVQRAAREAELLVTLEEHTRTGGFGSAVGETLLDQAPRRLPRLLRLGLPDAFAWDYGRQGDLLEVMGLGEEAILEGVRTHLRELEAFQAVGA